MMQLHLLNRSSDDSKSFTVSCNRYPNFLRIWHHHPEFELVVILQSTGTRFIGDSIEKFKKGDVVLIGKNLPHMWLNDEVYFQNNSEVIAEAVALHFKKEFLGTDFFKVPEMKSISKFLEKAGQGIKFVDLDKSIITQIKKLVNQNATTRVFRTLEILYALSRHKKYRLLASTGFVNSFQKTENRRMDKVYAYIFENFNEGISASDVAQVAGMNKSAFSRFFKKIHRLPFTRYLNEIKLGYACKLLLENKESITAIGYLSGFNNISNFNRQFKSVYGMSPSVYMKSRLS